MSKKKIEELKAENKKLKEHIANLQQTVERLEMQVAGLSSAAAIGRRGLPWS
tara:strand:- start:1791 stop:1946 length:156 start_codon:yes stop_codon:yes gene_type:complete